MLENAPTFPGKENIKEAPLSFPDSSAGKESTCNPGDPGSIPGLGRSPAEGNGYPLQYSGLNNFMDCVVFGVTKSRTRLRNFHFIGFEQKHLIAIPLMGFSSDLMSDLSLKLIKPSFLSTKGI